MLQESLTTMVFIATVGAGLMAGVYFAFSVFVMRSLDALGEKQAVAAMQSINDIILRSGFMPLFFGSTLVYALIVVITVFTHQVQGAWVLLTASIVYIAGMFLCTAFFNVPLNNRLASMGDTDNSEFWQHYFKFWLRWNHLRCLACVVAMVLGLVYFLNYV